MFRTLLAAIVFALWATPATAAVPGRQSGDACTRVGGTSIVQPDFGSELLKWIVEKTGWSTGDPAHICLVSQQELETIAHPEQRSDEYLTLRSLYAPRIRTIFLAKSWNSSNLEDRSYLLHELVHHLQAVNNIERLCLAAEELQAFELQLQWLREQGIIDPYEFIHTDRLTIFLHSQCLD